MNNDLKEACKTIAEFMGMKWIRHGDEWGQNEYNAIYVEGTTPRHEVELFPSYAYSLDALVPVWEKMDSFYLNISVLPCGNHEVEIYNTEENIVLIEKTRSGKTIQQAACLATARAIKELGEKE
jgi:hypothetical protein